MDTQSQYRGISFGPRLHTSTMTTCGRRNYEPKPLMKRVLNEVRTTQMAYKLPKKGNWNHNENRRGYDDKTKAKIANERVYKRNYNVKDRQNKVMLHIPKLYPTSIRLPFTLLTGKNTDPMAKGATKSDHVLSPTFEDLKQPATSRRSYPLKAKEGFLASSVEKSNPQMIRPKPMRGLVYGVHNGDTFKQYGVRLKGQSTLVKDDIGEDLKSCKGKNDSISKESNLLDAKKLLVPNQGNSDKENKRDKICKDKVMIIDDKKIVDHVNLGSIKSLKNFTSRDHYKDIMKRNEVPNSSPLTKDEPKKHDRDECEDSKNPRHNKKQRRYIVNADEEDDYSYQNPMDLRDEDSTKGSMPITPPESIKWQFYNCTQPIDEPIWSGIFKIVGEDYIPFSAHLSTKSCKKVWDLSRSIPSVVQVANVSRLEVWPKSLEASSPTDDNIGLYFFPHKMRLDKGMDQLVKKVVEKDMAFSAVIGEAQMLVFPSTLLPKKNQTFHGKHYLWGVFRRGGEYKKAAAIAAEQQPQHGSDDQRCKPQEQENTKEDASNEQQQRKEPNSNLQKTPALMKHAMRPVKEEQLPLSSAMDTHSSVVDEQCTAASVRERTDQRRPAEAGRGDAVPANHGRVIGLVVRQTPGLIQQMRRGGALVATMAGEMMGSGFGPN